MCRPSQCPFFLLLFIWPFHFRFNATSGTVFPPTQNKEREKILKRQGVFHPTWCWSVHWLGVGLIYINLYALDLYYVHNSLGGNHIQPNTSSISPQLYNTQFDDHFPCFNSYSSIMFSGLGRYSPTFTLISLFVQLMRHVFIMLCHDVH